jgi:hypothetical protein
MGSFGHTYKVIGVLGHLSSNALSGVESVPWFHGAKRLISERGRGEGEEGGRGDQVRKTDSPHFTTFTPLRLLQFRAPCQSAKHAFIAYTTGNFASSSLHMPTEFSITRKKSFLIFPSPAGMSLTKLFLGGNI